MRRFEIETPVAVDEEGLTKVDEIVLALTDEDVDDLNNGMSITTLTTQGEEVALFPVELCHVCREPFSKRLRCDCEVEA